MAISWQVIIALIIGGIASLSVGGFCLILWIARWRHRRALARLSAASDRRLSRYPNGHLTFTDDDFTSLPRARNRLRRPTRIPYRGPPNYANLSSNERIQQPPMARVSSAPVINSYNATVQDQQHSWPLPKRLTRSSSIPLAKMTAITEAPSPHPGTPKASTRMRNLGTYRGIAMQCKAPHNGDHHGLRIVSNDSTRDLLPKALFSEKPRSVSFSHLTYRPTSQSVPSGGAARASAATDRAQPSFMPRSSSLCNQQPGEAPTQPIPPLPTDILHSRFLQKAAATDIVSDGRLSTPSGFTSILDDQASKFLSGADADETSVDIIATPVPDARPKTLEVERSTSSIWDAPGMDRAPSPLQVAKSPLVRPKIEHQRSFRASIQNTLPSSGSSGLSVSLVDQAFSTTTSVATLGIDRSPTYMKKKLCAPDELKSNSRLSFPPRSPLRRHPIRTISDEVRVKRSSASALQIISGNEGSPMHNPIGARPLSIATENPFEWDPRMSMKPGKPSSKRDRKVAHKRQNCMRISNLQSVAPSPVKFGAVPEERTEIRQKQKQSPLRFSMPPVPHQPNWPIRPPSRVTFDPQIPPSTPTPAARRSSKINQAKAPVFTDLSTPPFSLGDLIVDTTEKPMTPHRGRAGANPNRHQKILSDPGNDKSFGLFTPQKVNGNYQGTMTSSSEQTGRMTIIEKRASADFFITQPSSRLFPFPSPPHAIRSSSPTSANVSPIRSPQGPRALPLSTTLRHPQARGPRVRVSKPSLPGNRLSDPRHSELCKSIATLRRMNSDISSCSRVSGSTKDGGGSKRTSILVSQDDAESPKDRKKGHGRYLSLGSSHSKSPKKRDSEEGLSPLAKTMQEEVRNFRHGRGDSCELIEGLLTGRSERVVRGPREMPETLASGAF